MTDPKPPVKSPAQRWDDLVRSGLSPETATAMVEREMGGRGHPSLFGRAAAALTTPVPVKALQGGTIGPRTLMPGYEEMQVGLARADEQALKDRGVALNAALAAPVAAAKAIGSPLGMLAPGAYAKASEVIDRALPAAGTGATAGNVAGNLVGYGLLGHGMGALAAAAPEGSVANLISQGMSSKKFLPYVASNAAMFAPIDVASSVVEGQGNAEETAKMIGTRTLWNLGGAAAFGAARSPAVRGLLKNERGALGVPDGPAPVFARDLVGKSFNEIDQIARQVAATERGAAARVFGDDGAKLYEQAQRRVNSAHADPYSMAFKEAESLIAKMESALTPAQEADLFGVGLPKGALNAEEMQGVKGLLAYHAPEHLASEDADAILLSMSRIIGGNRATGNDNSIALANMLRELRSRGLRDDTLIPSLGKKLVQRGMTAEQALAATQSRITQIGHDLGELADLPPRSAGLLPSGTAGFGGTPIMSGITGGVVGGSVGYASGDTPEEKRQRGILGALTGLGVGIAGGVAAERIGRKVKPPTVEPLPPRGNTPAEEYAKPSTFALDPTGEARLRDALERSGPLTRGDPKTVEPQETVRVIAQSMGLDDVLKGDATRLNRNELLAIRNIVHTNIDDIGQALRKVADPLTPQAEREQLSMAVAGLEQQNIHLLDRFTTARGEMGRNLNALKILASRSLDPVLWLSKAQQVRGSLGVPDELRAAIMRAINAEDRPALIQTIMDARQSTAGEKITTYWKANLLSNPATHVVNVSSNALLGGLEVAKAGPAYVADRLMQITTGQATQGGYSRSMGRASLEGARRGLAGAIRTIKTGLSPADLIKGDVPRQTNYANPILQAYTQSIFRTLGAEDQVFREAALSSSLANQAEAMARMEGWKGDVRAARVAELRTKPSDEMVVRAIGDAEEAVVRDQTAIGDVLSSINRFAPQGVPIGQVAVPFARTPGAVATRMGEYSPIGLTVGSVKTARVILRGLRGMDVPPDVQREAAKILGRGATGSALMGLGFYLASKGLATGPGDKDQSTWATQVVTGKMPTSVRVGDQWLEVGRFNPVGNLIAMGAFLHNDVFKSEEPVTPTSAVSSLGAATARTVMDQPFLTGIQNVLGELALDKQTAGRFAESVVSGIIPGSALLSAVARGRDHTQRQTPGMAGYLQSRLPGVGSLEGSEALVPQIDAFGKPKQRQGGVVEQMFNPSRRSVDKSADPVVKAMLDNGIKVTELRIAAGETPEQFAARAIAEGTRAYENVRETVLSSEFKNASRAQRQEMFKEAFARGRRWGLNAHVAP